MKKYICRRRRESSSSDVTYTSWLAFIRSLNMSVTQAFIHFVWEGSVCYLFVNVLHQISHYENIPLPVLCLF